LGTITLKKKSNKKLPIISHLWKLLERCEVGDAASPTN